MSQPDQPSDQERIDQAATSGKAPEWLRSALRRIGERAGDIRPLVDDRSTLPEFIYRH